MIDSKILSEEGEQRRVSHLDFEVLSRCPACGNKDFRFLVSKADVCAEEEFVCRLYRCKKCDFIFLNPQLSQVLAKNVEESSTFYDSWGEEKVAACGGVAELVSKFCDFRPGKVLEVGCGKGFLLKNFQLRGWKVWGVEFVEKYVRYAQEAFGLRVINRPFEGARFSPNIFDAVIMWHTLEHIKAPKVVLEKVMSILKVGGVFALEVPDFAAYRGEGNVSEIICPVHNSYFTPYTLRGLLSRAGFKLEFFQAHEKVITVVARKTQGRRWFRDSRFFGSLRSRCIFLPR